MFAVCQETYSAVYIGLKPITVYYISDVNNLTFLVFLNSRLEWSVTYQGPSPMTGMRMPGSKNKFTLIRHKLSVK